jgi:hypothetical protein
MAGPNLIHGPTRQYIRSEKLGTTVLLRSTRSTIRVIRYLGPPLASPHTGSRYADHVDMLTCLHTSYYFLHIVIPAITGTVDYPFPSES